MPSPLNPTVSYKQKIGVRQTAPIDARKGNGSAGIECDDSVGSNLRRVRHHCVKVRCKGLGQFNDIVICAARGEIRDRVLAIAHRELK